MFFEKKVSEVALKHEGSALEIAVNLRLVVRGHTNKLVYYVTRQEWQNHSAKANSSNC